jgi:hypothetical protein
MGNLLHVRTNYSPAKTSHHYVRQYITKGLIRTRAFLLNQQRETRLRSWMKLLVDSSQSVLINVGVYLGCGDIDVAEHFLYAP